MIGKNLKSTVLTILERNTRILTSCPLQRESKVEGTATIINLLRLVKDSVKSIKFDNIIDVAANMQVEDGMECDMFFAKPYGPTSAT